MTGPTFAEIVARGSVQHAPARRRFPVRLAAMLGVLAGIVLVAVAVAMIYRGPT